MRRDGDPGAVLGRGQLPRRDTVEPRLDTSLCPRVQQGGLDRRPVHNCDKFVLTGADLLYRRRKREQWRLPAESAPGEATADHLHRDVSVAAVARRGNVSHTFLHANPEAGERRSDHHRDLPPQGEGPPTGRRQPHPRRAAQGRRSDLRFQDRRVADLEARIAAPGSGTTCR
ncbi:hypothetical protein ACGGAI_02515 [Streptomyces antibioticus]|uniref:hypothetical protein n=1 Tax=Streptomyces antibioticus TaxID=1890 RepID=UPI0037222E55